VKKKTLVKAAAVLVTLLLVALLFTQVSLSDIYQTITRINPVYLIGGFVLYSCSYFFRALRFRYLLNNEIRVRDMFRIVCLHNLFNYLLPARSGEFSYVYLVNKFHGRKAGEGLATLIISRIFDYIIITLLFFLSFVLLGNLEVISLNVVILGIVFMMLLLVLLSWIMYRGRASFRYLSGLFGVFRLDHHHIGNYILRKCDETVQCMENLQETKPRMWIPLLLSSLGVWVSIYTLNFILILAMNIRLTYFSVIFASTFAILTTVLPFQGLGNFGTLEAGWTLGFVAVGVSKEMAISSGFTYHFVIILYFVVWGLWGFLSSRSRSSSGVPD
jgi:uncharacterized protein (TIRG00374 family)